MEWHYAEGSTQRGPVSEEEFNSLIAQGVITAETLVWRAGMSDWLPYGQVQPPPASAAGAEESAPAEPVVPEGTGAPSGAGAPQDLGATDAEFPQSAAEDVSLAAGDAATQLFCCECGRKFASDELINYGPSWVCAECKPLFFQKIREGATATGGLAYAGFWIRAVAWIIDYVIVFAITFSVSFVFGLLIALAAQGNEVVLIVLQVISTLFSWSITLFYKTYFVGKFAATPGKMALGLKVVMSDGGRVTYPRALGRAFAEILSGLICAIGYIIAAFDEEKRTLHDHICGTRVIRK